MYIGIVGTALLLLYDEQVKHKSQRSDLCKYMEKKSKKKGIKGTRRRKSETRAGSF